MKTKVLILSVLFCTFCALSVHAQNNDLADNKTNEKVYDVVETVPAFPGGEDALLKWLQGELKYPEDAAKKGDSGIVHVNFTVSRDGTIRDVHVIKSSNPVFNEEAIRVVKKMPKWVPAKQQGKDVTARFRLPIIFHTK